MGKFKGQLLVFEQVLLFAVGVFIFVICVFSFTSYESYFVETGNNDQLDQIGGYIAYAVIKASEGFNGTVSYQTIDIPKTIGNEIYRIRLSPGGLNISMLPSMKHTFRHLHWLNLTTEMGVSEVTSSAGMVVLYKNGNKIILL